jgi:CRP-like cAMP-binding protein
MAIIRNVRRNATVRALTDMRILTVDKKIFLRRLHEDPSFVYVILQKMSDRIEGLNNELALMRAKTGQKS